MIHDIPSWIGWAVIIYFSLALAVTPWVYSKHKQDIKDFCHLEGVSLRPALIVIGVRWPYILYLTLRYAND